MITSVEGHCLSSQEEQHGQPRRAGGCAGLDRKGSEGRGGDLHGLALSGQLA